MELIGDIIREFKRKPLTNQYMIVRGIDLSTLDTSEMSTKLQMQLAPFYLAYKPHGDIVSRKVLKVEGEGSYFKSEKAMDLVIRQSSILNQMRYKFIECSTRDDDGKVRDMNPDDDGYDEECCMSSGDE
jgi:hypothetical protein